MHPHDDLPRPVSPVIERPSLLHSVVTVVGCLALIGSLTFLFRLAMTPMPTAPSGTSALTNADRPSVAASPLVIALTVVMVTNTPEATALPTPTFAMLPTPRSISVCLTNTPKGETCEQPMPPLPTATPVLPCPVAPGSVCISQGKAIAWLTPTATPMPLTTSGLNN